MARIDVVKDYPAVYEHLKPFEKELIERQDKGDHWTNLRNCAYIQEFEKEKIVYPNMASSFSAYFDNTKYLTNQKCFIISGKNLKFLVSFLNSKLNSYYFRMIGAKLGNTGLEMSKIFVEKIPIPPLSENEQQPFIALVEEILGKKGRGENTTALEKEIDQLVYQLYELTPEEIEIVENN